MEDNKDNNPTPETNTEVKNDVPDNDQQQTIHNSTKQKKNHKTKKWLIVSGIVLGVIIIAYIIISLLGLIIGGIVVGIIGIVLSLLAASGVFYDLDNSGGGDSLEEKPIIYLYPDEKVDVTVRLGAPVKLTASYPKYTDSWNVTAYPNGDLIDKSNGNKLYSLYWEGKRDTSKFDLTTGFVIKGEDAASFLEEKLDILGLNYKEKEEFIVYWLPKLESNKYNYIYFATEEEINTDMPLEFSVQPDTIIRVSMIFKGLDEYQDVKEQTLKPAPERKGFTAVEWGGTEL